MGHEFIDSYKADTIQNSKQITQPFTEDSTTLFDQMTNQQNLDKLYVKIVFSFIEFYDTEWHLSIDSMRS